MSENKSMISAEGLEALKQNLKDAIEDRRKAVVAVAEGREHGDLKENAEYQTAREWQNEADARIKHYTNAVNSSKIVTLSNLEDDGVIRFGSKITLKILTDNDKVLKFHILGEYESNIEKGKLSVASVLAKNLLGKIIGDIVEIKLPRTLHEYEVCEVQNKY
ncbi:GreA/GreB family elongation factor [Rickettsiales bacterium]|nr:GreA/GreB family elongation factor [Rickettsiales bacterium]